MNEDRATIRLLRLDLEVTRTKRAIAEGDRVVTRKTFTGTHRGPLWGAAATGKSMTIEIIDIFRVRNGRLAEHWAHTDYLAMARQLGIAPPSF